MKRQRGRGRKPGGGGGGGGGGHQSNRTLESNGPDVKVRGSASHIYEKYVQLSRDAASSGDRVMSESYAQYAEHYFRMLRAMQPQTPVYEPQRFGHDLDYDQEEGDESGEGDGEGGEGEAHAGEQGYREQGGYRDQGGYREQQGGYRDQGGGGYRNDQRGRFQSNRHGHPYQQRGPRPQQDQGYAGGQETYARAPQPPADPRDEAETAHAPQEAPPGAAQGEQDFAQEGGQARGRNRRRSRGRFRPQDGAPRTDEGQPEGPVEGFGDSVPAFVGND